MNVWFLLWTGWCTLIDNCWAKDHSCSWQPHEWQQKPWPWWQQMGNPANESASEGSPVNKKTFWIRDCWKWNIFPDTRRNEMIWNLQDARWKRNLRFELVYRDCMAKQEMWPYFWYTFCTSLEKDDGNYMGVCFNKWFWEIYFYVSVKMIRKNSLHSKFRLLLNKLLVVGEKV